MIDPLLCSHCLASEDANTTFVAVFHGGTRETGPAVGANELVRWYDSIDPVALKWFEYWDMAKVLLPVAIWEGTPLCEPHLFAAKRGWRP